MFSTNNLTRCRHAGLASFTAAMVLAAVSWAQPATTAPAAGTQPAAGARNEQAIIADLQQNAGKMREILGGAEALTDPAKRAEIAPQIVPIFKRLISNFDELVSVQPMAKGQAEAAKQQFLVFLSLFG